MYTQTFSSSYYSEKWVFINLKMKYGSNKYIGYISKSVIKQKKQSGHDQDF